MAHLKLGVDDVQPQASDLDHMIDCGDVVFGGVGDPQSLIYFDGSRCQYPILLDAGEFGVNAPGMTRRGELNGWFRAIGYL